MLSLRAVAVPVVGFALLASSTESSATEADKKFLYTTLADVSTYNRDITTFICAYDVVNVQSDGTSTKFSVLGCSWDTPDFVGECQTQEDSDCSNDGPYNVFISKADTTKVIAIEVQPDSNESDGDTE